VFNTKKAKKSHMDYGGFIIRTPSKAGGFLLQLAVGCFYNKYNFRGIYRYKEFRIKPVKVIKNRGCKASEKVFLCDSEALLVSR